jgi:ribosomal protein L11 methyltransferase
MLYSIQFECSPRHGDFLYACFESFVLSCSFQEKTDDIWIFEGLTDHKPDLKFIDQALQSIQYSNLSLIEVPNENWLEKVYEQFPPFEIGNFFLHGSHYKESIPYGKIPLHIDAATAFGSGEHETTHGCLLAIERLSKRFKFHNALDLGCGSGVLAIALKKISPSTVVWASDIDPESIRVTNENKRLNNVDIQAYAENGISDDFPKFNLIIANILARPLCEMANDLYDHCHKNGMIILSGILFRQSKEVINYYTHAGFKLYQHRRMNGWSTLIFKK